MLICIEQSNVGDHQSFLANVEMLVRCFKSFLVVRFQKNSCLFKSTNNDSCFLENENEIHFQRKDGL